MDRPMTEKDYNTRDFEIRRMAIRNCHCNPKQQTCEGCCFIGSCPSYETCAILYDADYRQAGRVRAELTTDIVREALSSVAELIKYGYTDKSAIEKTAENYGVTLKL